MREALFNAANYQAIRPELLLILFGLAILALDHLLSQREKYLNAITAIIGLAFAGVQLTKYWPVFAGGDVVTAFSAGFTLDAFALYFKLIIVWATAIVVLMSAKYLEVEGAHYGTYYAFLLFCATGMMFLVSGTDLIVMLIALELMAVCEYLLAGFLRGNRRSNEAALKFFLLGAFASALLLYGMSLLYGITGTTNFGLIQRRLAEYSANDPIVGVAVATVFAGLCFMVAAVPFHQWAPDVYEGAPTSVTAFISVAPLVASFAILVRLLFAGPAPLRVEWKALTTGVAAATLVLSHVAALTQTNIKRFFGYSAISHAGYLLLGVAAAATGASDAPTPGQKDGLLAILIYLAAYAFMNLGAFSVIIVLRRKGLAGDEIDDLAGLISRSPGYAVLMLIFLLSLSGIPPTAGFMGKYFIFRALVETSHYKLAFLGIFFAVVAAYCYFRLVAVMFMRKSPDGVPPATGPGTSLALGAAVALTVMIGIYPQPVIVMAQTAVRSLF